MKQQHSIPPGYENKREKALQQEKEMLTTVMSNSI